MDDPLAGFYSQKPESTATAATATAFNDPLAGSYSFTPGPKIGEEERMYSEQLGRAAGRTPEEHAAYLKDKGYAPEQVKGLTQQYRLEQAREAERQATPAPILEDMSGENIAKTGAAVAERFARKSVSFSDVLPTRLVGSNTRKAEEAKQAFQKGEATPEQIKLIANEEKHDAIDAELGKTLGGKILQVTASVPKVLGEMAAGGKLLQAGGKALGFGRAATPAVSLSGTFSPMAARAALAEPTLLAAVGSHAGRMAVLTPLVPSMWVEEMQQRNQAEGKPANDFSNAPVSLAHAYANMLVLGSMQKNFGLTGNVAQKAAVKGGIFAGEQAVADSVFNTVDRQISGANKFNTKFGTLEHLLSGNVGEAAREATVQAFTGALFAGMHEIGGNPATAKPDRIERVMGEIRDAYAKDLDTLKRLGYSVDGASRRLIEMQERIRSGLDTAGKITGTNKPSMYAERMAAVFKDAQKLTGPDWTGPKVEPPPDWTGPGAEPRPETPTKPASEPTPTPAEGPSAPEIVQPRATQEAVAEPERYYRVPDYKGEAKGGVDAAIRELVGNQFAGKWFSRGRAQNESYFGPERVQFEFRSDRLGGEHDVVDLRAKEVGIGSKAPMYMHPALSSVRYRGKAESEGYKKLENLIKDVNDARAKANLDPIHIEATDSVSAREIKPQETKANEPEQRLKSDVGARPAESVVQTPPLKTPARVEKLTPAQARDYWKSLSEDMRADLKESSPDLHRDMMAAMKRGGIDPRNISPVREEATQKADETPLDPAIEQTIDAADLSAKRKAGVKALMSGASTRAAMKAAGVSHETVRKDAVKVFGENPVRLVEEEAVNRARQMVERTEQETTTAEGVRIRQKPVVDSGGALLAGFPLKIEALDRLAKSGLSARGIAQKWLTSAGDLPPAAMREKIKNDGRIAGYVHDVNNAVKDLKTAVGVKYERIPDVDLKRMNDALAGDRAAMASLPPEVRTALATMRQQIDALSQALKVSGAIQGKMIGVVDANLGSYLTRAYRVFTDPSWAKNVPEPVRNRFKSWMAAEIMKDQNRVASPGELEGIMRKLLVDGTAAENPIAFLNKGKLGSKDLGILTKRKDVPEPLRALWGEHVDPLVNYANTVGRMSNLLSNHLFLEEVKRLGMGEFLFTHDQMEQFIAKHPNSDPVTLAAAEGETMGPLNGLVTTREVKAAFEDVYARETNSSVSRLYMKMLGMAKYAKTVASPITHIRQVLGNTILNFSRGHFSFTGMAKSIKALRDDTQAGRDYYRELVEQQIVGDSVHGNEFKKVVDDALKHKDIAAGEMLGFISADRQASYVRKTFDAGARAYQAEDAMVKITAYEAEKAAYGEAYPTWTEAEIRQKAAENVRIGYPSWSQMSAALKATRKMPFGPFVTFPAEIIRTTYQTARLAISEMRTPETRAIGARRMAYLMGSYGLTMGLAATSRLLAGVDWDEEKAMRRFLPEWSRNNQLWHIGRDDKGQPKTIDMGPTDPNSILLEPIQAAFLSGGNGEQRIRDVIDAVTKPLTGEEVSLRPILDVARNKNEQTGGEVYNPQDTTAGIVSASAKHIGKAFLPGAVEQGRRLGMAILGQDEAKSGKKYDLGEEAIAAGTGQRIMTVEIGKSFGIKAKTFAHAYQDAEKLFLDVAKGKGTISDDALRSALAKSEGQRRKAFDDFREDVVAAEKLGLSREKIMKMLKDGGVDEAERGRIMSGRYVPNVFPSQSLKGLPAGEAQKRLAVAKSAAPAPGQ